MILTNSQWRFSLPLVLALLVLGCSDESVEEYEARGELIGVADGGSAVVIHHEEIEDFMGPMVMTVWFWSDEDERAFADLNLEQGDALEFRLVQSRDVYIRDVRRLPDDTELDLPTPLER